jgi:hypothetical protein
MYVSTHYIQNIAPKNMHVIMRICELQATVLLLPQPAATSMITSVNKNFVP